MGEGLLCRGLAGRRSRGDMVSLVLEQCFERGLRLRMRLMLVLVLRVRVVELVLQSAFRLLIRLSVVLAECSVSKSDWSI